MLDPDHPQGRSRLIELAGSADIVVDSGNPGSARAFGTSCAELSDRFGHLVTLSVTDFGTTGPRAAWRATDAVLYSMSSALSRTGPTSGTPVLPPTGVASATAAVQAAWAVLVAYYDRLRCGKGEFIDFSRFEAVVQALDPPFGSEGQAVVGLKATTELWRGRPRNQQIYPIFECRDGHVRICLLSARQWRGMRAWLGEPDRFSAPEFDTIAARYAASRELNAAIAELFGPETMASLVAQGQTRGVPIAAVLTPAEALSAAHFREVGALADAELTPGVTVTIPVGHLSREFRLAYGESPYGYLMTRRIERAMALLRRGDLSVTEVCFAVGCSSLGSFSSRFSELVGMPPSVYRRTRRSATAGMPSCVAKQVTRPIRNREARVTEPQLA